MKSFSVTLLFLSHLVAMSSLAAPEPVPYQVPARLADAAETLSPAAVHLDGWLGARIQSNATNRLLNVNTEPLLAGFRKKPGVHPWIGEHVGKWMHAATLAWVYTGDERLKQKLDGVAADLVACQEPDGYLGTYVPEKRFGLFPEADWDVWSHKYNLIGLLTYYQYTGNQPALDACRRMGDLLINTFGPDRKSILSAGTHVGMAATSVLEPMVLLYRFTADERYLQFARYIVKSWDEPKGPGILQTLLKEKQVNKTANGKAYEMLSNLVGLCELARITGERAYLEAVVNAWEDVTAKRLYFTGSASQGEHFRGDYELPNQTGAHVAETCVTTTWIQLNLQLYRLLGEARFGDELEKTLYNHLAAAQHPRGDDWCYFTALEGRKPYDAGINCCHSSGPRGMALAPLQAYLKGKSGAGEALLISTFETSTATVTMNGTEVRVVQQSRFPYEGKSELRFSSGGPAFALKLRVPAWAAPLRLKLNGKPLSAEVREGWATVLPQKWAAGDRLEIDFRLAGETVEGRHTNRGLDALRWGPFVLAYDAAFNPDLPSPMMIGLAKQPGLRLSSKMGEALRFTSGIRTANKDGAKPADFVPFADAGASGQAYRVWLPSPDTALKDRLSLLAGGQESRSRSGNVGGSIVDADPGSFVVTFDGTKRDEDWFAVQLDGAVKIGRVVFVSGNVFHDGGWFDASAGKPRIEIKRDRASSWEKIAEIADYPATTATNAGPLNDASRRRFEVKLNQQVSVAAIRVIGKPACGDNPNQAFASCAELEAFSE